jgi:3-oxoacid CoA-transferase
MISSFSRSLTNTTRRTVLFRATYATVNSAPIPKSRKVYDSVDEAVKDVKSGDVLLSGGESRS